ncbi:MAG: hypothetical protein O2857_19370, partial [Planctomycetota bacterium]|nr:hypothetical protein [Planctomycetota bacterium]
NLTPDQIAHQSAFQEALEDPITTSRPAASSDGPISRLILSLMNQGYSITHRERLCCRNVTRNGDILDTHYLRYLA